ncbi:MAG: prepilin-type N-terminal cleavage/methylation domain-containing protein [Candidatus Rokubacteria bacterium]|nr:prepilin-type N-terminal cleavage/methylation domain-containing protein [Candidatus Rokubacteria bacterium]MBI3825557.1 prepilin-type N-terminal cleavage/methylation domain-containing protein [Candidatus Rokubacteria bacterium]
MTGDPRGFTLAEVMVATAVIAIALVGLASVVPFGVSGVQIGNQLSVATFLAQERLEQARGAVWTDTPGTDCLGTSSNASNVPTSDTCNNHPNNYKTFGDDETDVTGFAGYARTTRVFNCNNGTFTALCSGTGAQQISDPDLRVVRVRVTYTPLVATGMLTGTPITVELTALVAKRGLATP